MQGDGCWRLERIEEKTGEDQWITRLRPKGLDMAEALTRAGPDDAETRDALVILFAAIEAGAIAGALSGHPSDPKDGEG